MKKIALMMALFGVAIAAYAAKPATYDDVKIYYKNIEIVNDKFKQTETFIGPHEKPHLTAALLKHGCKRDTSTTKLKSHAQQRSAPRLTTIPRTDGETIT